MSITPLSPRLRPLSGIAAVALLVGLTACSAAPQASPDLPPTTATTTPPTESDAAPSSAIGREEIVTRDGHDLAFYVTPGATGTIVLDAGGGNDASYWNGIVPDLAEATGAAIVTYDRSGVGQSDFVPGAFDPAAAGEDLAAGLESLDLPYGPVVLAGHSIAGEVAHALVNAHPDLVEGGVLIDANLPPFFTPEQTARLVAANEEQVAALESGPETPQTRQFLAVAENWGPVHTAFHAVTWPEEIPVTVVVAEQTPMPAGSQDAQNWRDAAKTFTDQASNRRLVTAVGSSHDVPLDDPELVEREIVRLYESL